MTKTKKRRLNEEFSARLKEGSRKRLAAIALAKEVSIYNLVREYVETGMSSDEGSIGEDLEVTLLLKINANTLSQLKTAGLLANETFYGLARRYIESGVARDLDPEASA
jgi:hypothetical protein